MTYDPQQQIKDLEAMLEHASATIARLEGAWRSPKAERPAGYYLVIKHGAPIRIIAHWNGRSWWFVGDIGIVAWRELPQLPAADGYGDLK